MCECKEGHTIEVEAKKFRLADFFDKWWDIYNANPKEYIHPEQYKAVNAIMACRTAALGVDIYACPTCGEVSEVYHSCKNRFCPTCSWNDTVCWADMLKQSMLNIPHRHVVFTLPHQLNPLIKRNNRELLNILMRTTADVFKDWIGHKYGLDIGIISVLHTFGELKNYHPHVHMIVTWGGLNKKTRLLETIQGDYVNYEFLQKKFRCKFEDAMIDKYDSGILEHGFKDRISFLKFIKTINNKHWVLHLEPPMKIPTAVIRYIGRYSKRACLSEYKITSMEGESIKFRYKDYSDKDFNGQAKEKEIELHYSEFIPRLLQHVPLPGFRIVRYYGIYSNKACIPKDFLYNETEQENEAEWVLEEDPKYCYRCNREKVYQHTEVKKRFKEKLGQIEKIQSDITFIFKREVA